MLRHITFIAAFLGFMPVALTQQVKSEQQVAQLPPGYSPVNLTPGDEMYLESDLKDEAILNSRAETLRARIEEAKARYEAIEAEYRLWIAKFHADVESVRRNEKLGDDVNYDFDRKQFVRGPKSGHVTVQKGIGQSTAGVGGAAPSRK